MNNAGLPGTGLGGLFYILLALWMPVAELNATVRGRSSRARWRQVGTQFALACGIIAAVGGTVATYMRLVEVPSTLRLDGPTLVLAPMLFAALLLSGLVVVLRVWARILVRTQTTQTAAPDRCDPPARRGSLDDDESADPRGNRDLRASCVSMEAPTYAGAGWSHHGGGPEQGLPARIDRARP